MDQHQHRYYATSERFTFLGRSFNPENTSLAQSRGNLRDEVHSHYQPNPGSWYPMPEQFIFAGRSSNPENTSLDQMRGDQGEVHSHYHSNPGSWSNVEMDRHQHRSYVTSEPFIIRGGRSFNPENISLVQTRGNLRDGVHSHSQPNPGSWYSMSEQFIFPGRSSYPNTFLAQTRGNLQGEIHSHYHSNPGSWSNVHDASNFSLEMPCLELTTSGPSHSYHPFTFLTGSYSVYTPPSIARHTHGVIDTSTAVGRLPLKRKSPDVLVAFDIGSSRWIPFEARSSISGLWDRQFVDNQDTSQYTMRSNHPITSNDSGRNVRSRVGRNLAPTPITTNHLNFTSQHFHTTNVPVNRSVATHYPHNNANASAAWNSNFSSSHGPGRTPASETNAVSSEANQILMGRHGEEASQYGYDDIVGGNVVPPLQYLEPYRNRIPSGNRPTRHLGDEYEAPSDYHLQFPTEIYSSRYSWSSSTDRWYANYQNDRATGAIERYTSHATVDRNDRAPLNGSHAGYESTFADYRLQFPTEAYSSGYSRSSTRTRQSSYQSGRAMSTSEYFPSLAAAMNRNDSMEPQHHVTEEDITSYSPIPGNTYAYDHYEDMRLDIDNMSYEELLALGEQIGNVTTGLSEDKMSNCLVESLNCASEQNKEDKLVSDMPGNNFFLFLICFCKGQGGDQIDKSDLRPSISNISIQALEKSSPLDIQSHLM